MKVEKKKIRYEKLRNFFQLTWKRTLIIVIVLIASVVSHNAYYKLLGAKETIFSFIVIILIPIYFLISLVYSIIMAFINQEKLSKQTIIALIIGLIGGAILSTFTIFKGVYFLWAYSLIFSVIVYYLINFLE